MIIYDINDKELLDAIVTESADHEQELSKSNFVKLSWESDMKITIPVGSYIVPFEDGLKYRLFNAYTPSENKKGFKYEPCFHHPLIWLSRVPFLYTTKDENKNDIKQQEWAFEGLTVSALEYVCKAINEAFNITDENNKFTYTLCGTVDSSISFSISSNDILSALSSIAQACKNNKCEWHLSWEHKALYFGQIAINLGEKVPLLKVHDNIKVASVNNSKEDFYNCFYSQGSTKNMSRKAQVGTGNVATLARLGLDISNYPDGCVYTDNEGNVITKAQFEASKAIKQTLALSFNDIFPHIDLYAYNIRKRIRFLKNKTTGEYELDGKKNKKTYTVWYMRLAYCTTIKDEKKMLVNTTIDKDEQGNTVTHYWYDYFIDKKTQILQGYALKGIFKVNTHTTNNKYDALTQSLVGQPNGQDGFELHFHENDNTIPVSETTGDSGVSILKGDYEIVMHENGNVIIPSNEEDSLIPRGNELPDLTCNIVVLFNIVMGEYETKTAQRELAKRTLKTIAERAKDKNNYTAGSDPIAFKGNNPNLYIGQKVTYDDGFGYQLSTRVIKLVTKLDCPIIQEITVGNQSIKGNISQLKEDVNNILSGNFSGAGLNSEQVYTLLANYTNQHLLRKDIPNEANITNKGKIINDGIIVTKNLLVTNKASFFELQIEETKAAGGVIVQSIAEFHVDDVEETEEGYVCYQVAEKDGVKLRQMCQEGDQMLCYGAFNTEIKTAGNNSQFYWRYVSKAPLETEMRYLEYDKATECLKIVLSKGDCAGYSTAPQRGDSLVQIGNRTDKERQSVIVSAATFPLLDDLKPPYWAKYTGINNYELTAHRETFFSKDKNQIIGTLLTKAEDGTYQPIPDDLVKQFSEIKQTANKISFKVAEQDKGLRAAGIDIESGQIVATADNFKVKNSSGTETFLINKDGQITADNISLDGLDAKDAVIKNLKMQSNYSLSPFFLTNETLHEFLDHAYKPYAGWGSYYAWPFDFASFIVIGSEEVITKKHITGFLDSGMWEDFTTNRNEMKPESSWGSSFYSDYYKVPKITYWLSLLGKTVMIANSINRSFGFGVEIPDRERYIRKHAPLDLMDLPEHTYQGGFFNYVSLLPNQIGIFKYVTVSGAPDFAKKDKDYKPKVYGVWLKQAVYDFNITANIIKAAYDVDPNFSIFEEKYLNLFGKKGHTWDYNLPKERKE